MIDDDDLLSPALAQSGSDETRVNVGRGARRGVRNNRDRLLRVIIRLRIYGGSRQPSQPAQRGNADPIPIGSHLILPATAVRIKRPSCPFHQPSRLRQTDTPLYFMIS